MKTLSLLVTAAFLQATPPEAVTPAAPSPVPRFAGTLAEGLAELERHSREGRVEEAIAVSEALLAPNEFSRWRRELEAEGSKVIAPALELADPLLERLGLNGYAEPLRAEVIYARGCARLAAEERAAAEAEFAAARAASGPGELRLAASYNRGTVALLEAEAARALIPEVSGQAIAPLAPPGAGPPPPDEEQADPLEVARAHYERAKESLVERLRLDWRDADTRANVELIQRRLKELDEIERQREEQQQEQQQQQDQQQDQQQQDDSQSQDPSDDSQQDESEQEQQQEQEQEQEQEQPAESEGEEPEPEEDEAEGEEQPSEEEGSETQEPAEAEPQEVFLTREEVQRLLERLRAHEEEAEALRARLYQQSRRRVERDW